MNREKTRTHFGPCLMAVALLFGVWLTASSPAAAVILDDEDVITITLDDGTKVVLYAEAKAKRRPATGGGARPNLREIADEVVPGREDEEEETAQQARPGLGQQNFAKPLKAQQFLVMANVQPAKDYYYLPTNLHLSQRPDKTPEFLLLKFTTEERAAEGGVSGAIMHFLMEWGLTPAQETELADKLKAINSRATLAGAVPMEPAGETGTFQIVSATLSDESMAPSLVTSGKAPLVPGGKAAAAARLSANGAQLLDASLERNRSITDVSIALDFSYTTLTPAARGWISFNWEKLQAEREIIEAEFRDDQGKDVKGGCAFIFCAFWTETTHSYSYDELREFYKYMEEKKVVEISFDELVEDERVEKIRQAFFDYFLQSMTDSVPPPPPAEAQEPYAMPDIQKGLKYEFNREVVEVAFERKTETFDLNYRLAVKRPHQLVGNLASWYDHVRDNPKCVAAVNLNDPFFQHRDIHFIVDLDAKEMFDETVNYVTVDVRKRRSEGRDFENHVTIDAEYMAESGVRSSVTYARGNDSNPDLYEYKAQWSLKGGQVFPENPNWTSGSWEGVTLAPPVVPRTIEVEADLDELTDAEISRVTAQVRYYKFGEEVEENIHVSPARGESLVESKIFTDRDTRGYVYRLIVNHKREGKLALDWQPQVNDNYIFATIPQELIDQEPTLLEEAKAAATEALTGSKGNVLDRFKDLIAGGD